MHEVEKSNYHYLLVVDQSNLSHIEGGLSQFCELSVVVSNYVTDSPN